MEGTHLSGKAPARQFNFWTRLKSNRLCLLLLLAGAVTVPAQSQWLLTGKDEETANRLFDSNPHNEPLDCKIERQDPTLDFLLRFDSGFLVTCPFWVTDGDDTPVTILTRVTPEGGKSVLFGLFGNLRGSPVKMQYLDPEKIDSVFRISGEFSVGEGRYHVEVLVGDSRDRDCRADWTIQVSHREQSKSPVVMAANTVSAIDIPSWKGASSTGGGLRVTIFLEASPAFHANLNQMTVMDRVLLVQFLTSVLEQTPCRSVRLVAFTLERQEEIFRADPFEPSGIAKLQAVLAQLELRTVPAQVLQKPDGWVEMLTKMVNEEIDSPDPADAVVFLGRSKRWMSKLPVGMRKPGGKKPHFFAFQFESPFDELNQLLLGNDCTPVASCAEPPDATAYLAKALGGTVYKIYSPRDLGKATKKMVAKVRP